MRISKYKLLVFLFVLYSFILNGQNNATDSLRRVLQTQEEDTNKVNVLIALSSSFANASSYDSALQYADRALSLSEGINFKKGKGTAYKNIGLINQTVGNYVTARNNYLAGTRVYEELGDKSNVAWCTNRIANSYYTEGDMTEAIKISYNALKIYEESKDKAGIALTYLFIGAFYYEDKNYSESLKNFLLSLKLHEEIGSKNYIAYSKLFLGKIDVKQGNYSEAIRKYSEVLKVFEEVKEKGMIAEVHRSMGELFESVGEKNSIISKNNYSEALKNYLKNLSLWEEIKDKGGLVTGYFLVGNIHIKLGNFQTAKIYLEKALQLGKEIGSKGDLKNIYQSFSTLDSAQANYKQAFEHHKMYIIYRDSISNEETKRQLLRTTMQYEYDKKEALARAEQEKKDILTKRTRNLQYTAIAAILLIAVFLFWNNRQKQKSKAQIERAYSKLKSTQQQLIQSEKMASLGELTAGIAHEIQNPLNFVNNFSEVNKELIEELKSEKLKVKNERDEELEGQILNDIKQNLEKINHHGKRADAIVKGMLQHSRASSGQKELTDINKLADEYLRLAYHGLRAKDKDINVTLQTDFDSSFGKINIVPQEIGRVALNLINNAFYAVSAKAAELGKTLPDKPATADSSYEPSVKVSTKKLNDKVEIKVSDNGNGIPKDIVDKIFQPFFTTKPTGEGTGLGLSLAYDIIKAHGGELKVETKEGEGSEFIIQLPG